MRKYIIILLISIVTVSCVSKKEIIKTEYITNDSLVYVDKYEKVYDTIVTPADSSYIEAYFECDSNNTLILRQLNESEGKKINIKTIYKDNIIRIEASIDTDSIIRQAEERIRSEYTSVNNKITTDESVTTKNLVIGFWQKIYMLIAFVIGVIVSPIVKKVFVKVRKLVFKV
jgi:hypothetical protein